MTEPLILSFDTSGPYCAVAVLRGDDVVAAWIEEMTKGQAERLMPMIEAALSEAAATPRDLTAIGVGIGPGNFTGVRIAVSAARGLALALGVPAVGVSVLEALAFGQDAPVLASVDARQDRLYVQRFGAGVERAAALVALEDVAEWAEPGLRCVGHRSDEIAQALRAEAHAAVCTPAAAIARIAAGRWQDDLPRPAPIYLRAADAAPSKEVGPVMLP